MKQKTIKLKKSKRLSAIDELLKDFLNSAARRLKFMCENAPNIKKQLKLNANGNCDLIINAIAHNGINFREDLYVIKKILFEKIQEKEKERRVLGVDLDYSSFVDWCDGNGEYITATYYWYIEKEFIRRPKEKTYKFRVGRRD